MLEKSRAQRLAEALAQAGTYRQHAEEYATPAEPRFTIALSRETGSGATSVANEVGARLNWPVYDHELLRRIAQEMHLRVQLLASVDERRRNWLQECIEAFPQSAGVSEAGFVRHLIETVTSLGSHGACVIVGRGAAHILPAAHTLRVRLVAAAEDRVSYLSRLLNRSREETARRIETSDRERALFVREHFRKDVADPRNYDLVLNTSRFSVAECGDLVIESLRRLEAHAGRREPALAR
jgi:cytidylate kinase